jgi:hypothetical protein
MVNADLPYAPPFSNGHRPQHRDRHNMQNKVRGFLKGISSWN